MPIHQFQGSWEKYPNFRGVQTNVNISDGVRAPTKNSKGLRKIVNFRGGKKSGTSSTGSVSAGVRKLYKIPKGYKNLKISRGVKNQQPRQQGLFLKGKKIIQNFRGEKKNFKISEGVFRDGTLSTSIFEGLEKSRKIPRGSFQKPFPKGSKISNLVNRGVWILITTVAIKYYSRIDNFERTKLTIF
jgi:hypothetical protein